MGKWSIADRWFSRRSYGGKWIGGATRLRGSVHLGVAGPLVFLGMAPRRTHAESVADSGSRLGRPCPRGDRALPHAPVDGHPVGDGQGLADERLPTDPICPHGSLCTHPPPDLSRICLCRCRHGNRNEFACRPLDRHPHLGAVGRRTRARVRGAALAGALRRCAARHRAWPAGLRTHSCSAFKASCSGGDRSRSLGSPLRHPVHGSGTRRRP